MTSLLAIAGSYRPDGIIDQAVAVAVAAARQAGADVEVIQLRNYPIEFCMNCRQCMQAEGAAPGPCVHTDAMGALIEKIERADAYILASPTNFYTVTALFKRFMERLAVYAFWPWGAHGPKFRKGKPSKKALVICSAAAPAFIGRFVFSSVRQLKATAKVIGARPSSVFIGLAAGASHTWLTPANTRRIERATVRLLEG
jgi:NAD(P)H-dependent FMN reductase